MQIIATMKPGEKRTVIGGICRRYAASSTSWPTTREDDWCGEWNRKDPMDSVKDAMNDHATRCKNMVIPEV